MVVDTLKLISEKSDFKCNIIRYFVDSIKGKKKLKKIFEEIKKIHNIGNKKAALALRDTVDLFHLEDYIPEPEEEFIYLQPIDTYVHKMAKKLTIIKSEKPNWKGDSNAIVKSCLKHGISPIKFNQGAWYLGRHCFDIILSLLSL